MLSDEQLWDANAAGVIVYQSTHRGLQYAAEGEAIAGLRAVEAAVRADQIEKDAVVVERLLPEMGAHVNVTPYRDGRYDALSFGATTIRAQLAEGPSDE